VFQYSILAGVLRLLYYAPIPRRVLVGDAVGAASRSVFCVAVLPPNRNINTNEGKKVGWRMKIFRKNKNGVSTELHHIEKHQTCIFVNSLRRKYLEIILFI
jgi:hypothetical protein